LIDFNVENLNFDILLFGIWGFGKKRRTETGDVEREQGRQDRVSFSDHPLLRLSKSITLLNCFFPNLSRIITDGADKPKTAIKRPHPWHPWLTFRGENPVYNG
jgi:hypothetical protein